MIVERRQHIELQFDFPERLDKIVVIDIVPTASMFQGFGNVKAGLEVYHWLFLAQPEPFPETMIGAGEVGKMLLEHCHHGQRLVLYTINMANDAMKAIKTNSCLARPHVTIQDFFV